MLPVPGVAPCHGHASEMKLNPVCVTNCREAKAVLLFVQGYKLALEMWKVLEEDQRWAGLTGDFAPDVFNPDRHVF